MSDGIDTSERRTLSIPQAIDLAVQHHNAGDLSKAETIYRQVLQSVPNHPEVLHLLGVIAHQGGKNVEAVDLIGKALATQPNMAEAHNNLGVSLFELGRLDEAVTSYQTAVTLKPDYTDAHNNHGNALQELNKLDDAVLSYCRAVTLKPDFVDASYKLGNVYRKLGKLSDAIASYQRALDHKPDHAEAHYNLGVTLKEQGKLQEAVASYRKAIAVQPNMAIAYNNLGLALKEMGKNDAAIQSFRSALVLRPELMEAHYNLGNTLKVGMRFDEAVESYQNALKIDPDAAEIHNNLGNVLQELGQLADAKSSLYRALVLDPEFAEAHNNLGNILRDYGQLEEAKISYQTALRISPNYLDAQNNLGLAFQYLGQLNKAIECFERALKIQPDNAASHFALSQAVLMNGDFRCGFQLYEWRWKYEKLPLTWRQFPQPVWDGSDLRGKTILVWGEQGIGDEIVFASLYRELVARGANCVFECQYRLVELLQRSFPDTVVVAASDPPAAQTLEPHIDFQCPAGSLMKWLLPSFNEGPDRENYLIVDADFSARLRSRYRTGEKQKVVGLAWWTQHNIMNKSYNIPPNFFDELLQTPNVQFVNLQYGDQKAELDAVFNRTGVSIIQDEEIDPLVDMDAFAAQQGSLDLVISIVNSTAVLASGLGVPVWGVLPTVSEWRWGNVSDRCLWYPSMRIFRQSDRGDWSPVFAEMATAFQKWAKETE